MLAFFRSFIITNSTIYEQNISGIMQSDSRFLCDGTFYFSALRAARWLASTLARWLPTRYGQLCSFWIFTARRLCI